jgi:hypothetical protein
LEEYDLTRQRMATPHRRAQRRPGLVPGVPAEQQGVGQEAVMSGGVGDGRRRRLRVRSPSAAYTFVLNRDLVESARQEVGEDEVTRSIEAALIAAIDYRRWLSEVERGERGVRE